jgi:dTDP-4-dehydrorhamnose reductase
MDRASQSLQEMSGDILRVLITGGTGQLGHALSKTRPESISIVSPDRQEMDLSEPHRLPDLLRACAPDAIINAAAYTAVDQAEREPEIASAINAQAPGRLAEYCASAAIPLIHVSTDFVFDGNQNTPYGVDAAPAPLCVYGATKFAGEQAVQENYPGSYVVRSSWIYSEHGSNFVKNILRLAQERNSLSVVNDQTGTPTYARNLAKVLWQLLKIQPEERLLHAADGGATTWYGFALAICEQAEQTGLLPATPEIKPISAHEYGAPAARPAYSVLDSRLAYRLTGLQQIDWRDSLRDMLARLSRA